MAVSFPVNTVSPLITPGAVSVGAALACSTGSWTSTNGIAGYSYQWKRGGAAISGATSASYTPGAADVGAAVTCTVTCTNTTSGTTSRDASNTPTVVAVDQQAAVVFYKKGVTAPVAPSWATSALFEATGSAGLGSVDASNKCNGGASANYKPSAGFVPVTGGETFTTQVPAAGSQLPCFLKRGSTTLVQANSGGNATAVSGGHGMPGGTAGEVGGAGHVGAAGGDSSSGSGGGAGAAGPGGDGKAGGGTTSSAGGAGGGCNGGSATAGAATTSTTGAAGGTGPSGTAGGLGATSSAPAGPGLNGSGGGGGRSDQDGGDNSMFAVWVQTSDGEIAGPGSGAGGGGSTTKGGSAPNGYGGASAGSRKGTMISGDGLLVATYVGPANAVVASSPRSFGLVFG